MNAGTTGNKFFPRNLSLGSVEWPYSKQVYAFERVITTMSKLLGKQILPIRRQLSNSLRLLGATHGKQGLKDRPQMQHQQATLRAISSHFEKHRGITVDEPPDIAELPPFRMIAEHETDIADRPNWVQRISRYNAARKRR